MIATDILTEEHRIILKGLDCLDRIATEAAAKGTVDRDAGTTAIRFLREFADHCHHAKEEDRLFPSMEQSGMPRQGGPIAVMLDEHDEGRGYVARMAESLDAAAVGDGEALAAFCESARHFGTLLRAHIAKEDQVLFPMATQVLSGEAQEVLVSEFRQIEAAAAGRHTRYLEMVRSLCERCQVEPIEDRQIPTILAQFS